MGIPLSELYFHVWILVIWCVTCNSWYLSSMLQKCKGSVTVLLDTGTQKARSLNISAVETSDPIYFLYIIIQGIQIFGLCLLRAGVYVPSGWDFLHLGSPLFRRVVQEYMHGPCKEGVNSTSVLIICMLKFNGTSYVIASLATAYLCPVKLILVEV